METHGPQSPMQGDTQDAELAALRRAVLNDPRNGELRYLLAAHMAQQRDYDSAVLEFSAAIALNPQLHGARFQLGLLHLTLGQLQHAFTVLAPLEDLGDGAALKFFMRGLMALARDDFAACVENLRHGMHLNTDNEPLNRDMAMLLERVQTAGDKALASQPAATAGAPGQTPADADVVRTDFSLYGESKH